jgi:S-adenosylmethionine hydrolase
MLINFPKESIHIISVDSFFHKDRKNILVKADGHYFISADNGLLSLIFYDVKPKPSTKSPSITDLMIM